jgi:hypothetical protein
MFFPANHSSIFSCPLCENTADAVVCDGCYQTILSWMDVRYESSITYWFKADIASVRMIRQALESGLQWPNIVVAHILRTYFFRYLNGSFLAGEYAQGLVDALNFHRFKKNDTVVQVDWFDQNAALGRLNWVMFYD